MWLAALVSFVRLGFWFSPSAELGWHSHCATTSCVSATHAFDGIRPSTPCCRISLQEKNGQVHYLFWTNDFQALATVNVTSIRGHEVFWCYNKRFPFDPCSLIVENGRVGHSPNLGCFLPPSWSTNGADSAKTLEQVIGVLTGYANRNFNQNTARSDKRLLKWCYDNMTTHMPYDTVFLVSCCAVVVVVSTASNIHGENGISQFFIFFHTSISLRL